MKSLKEQAEKTVQNAVTLLCVAALSTIADSVYNTWRNEPAKALLAEQDHNTLSQLANSTAVIQTTLLTRSELKPLIDTVRQHTQRLDVIDTRLNIPVPVSGDGDIMQANNAVEIASHNPTTTLGIK